MMPKFAIERADGGVSIMTLVDGTLADALRKWGDANPGQYVSHKEIDPATLPADRSTREAWKLTANGLEVDQVKLQAIVAAKEAVLKG